MKRFRRTKAFLLFVILTLLVSNATPVFAAQTVNYTTNGNAAQYVAGSVLVLYGKVEDSGKAVPNTAVIVDIQDSAGKVIYYGQLKTDNRGYFKTNFTIPSGVSGSMTVKISTTEGVKVNASYSLNSSGNVKFTGYLPKGYQSGESVTTIPASTTKLGIVFNSNVNYFNNRSGNLGLSSLGVNERNRDCIDLYEKNSQGNFVLVASSVELVSSDTQGNAEVNGIFYAAGVSEEDKKKERKDILYVVPDNGLKANTTYKVVIDKDLSANNSATLGSNVEVFFTTGSGSTGTASGSGTGTNLSEVPTVSAKEVGIITTSGNTSVLAVDSSKASAILKNNDALSIDLSTLKNNDDSKIDVKIPASVLAAAKNENKQIILNYGGYVMAIPPGSLPIDQEIVIEAKASDVTSTDKKPDSVKALQLYEFNATDKHGDKVPFNRNLKVEFELPKHTVKPERLCIYYIDETSGEWIYSGGRVVNNKLVFTPSHYSSYVVSESTKTFTDIQNHWAKDVVEAMAARQISKGTSENIFTPDNKITRAEFAVLLSRALGLAEENNLENPFADVLNTAWYQKDVVKMASVNVITGNNGKFRPNDPISRQEMAVMLSRAYKYINGEAASSKETAYKDKAAIGNWAKEGVAQAASLETMTGYPDGSFGPLKNSTRAEATKTLKGLMDTLGI